jgi:hypothetical protein
VPAFAFAHQRDCKRRRSEAGRRTNEANTDTDARADARALQGETRVFTIPILLVVMTVVLAGLIYWGGFAEEARNR